MWTLRRLVGGVTTDTLLFGTRNISRRTLRPKRIIGGYLGLRCWGNRGTGSFGDFPKTESKSQMFHPLPKQVSKEQGLRPNPSVSNARHRIWVCLKSRRSKVSTTAQTRCILGLKWVLQVHDTWASQQRPGIQGTVFWGSIHLIPLPID